jgi:serine/threonine protein kinase
MENRFESFPPATAESAEVPEVEMEVSDLLDELPEELAERWEDAHRGLGSQERKTALTEFLDKRKHALHESIESKNNPEHVQVVETSPLALLNMIENIEKGPHENLGAGQAGRVIASVRYPNVCYKVMFPMDRIPNGTNDISVEADLQDEIAAMGEVHGVRAPKVFSFIHEGAMRAITMERLNAVSMRDVIDGKESLPDAFKQNSFMDKLERYITDLNARGYYHRDLHEGNVMIDKETGAPYVIDFGYAKYSPLPDDAYELTAIKSGHKVDIVLPFDSASLKNFD